MMIDQLDLDENDDEEDVLELDDASDELEERETNVDSVEHV